MTSFPLALAEAIPCPTCADDGKHALCYPYGLSRDSDGDHLLIVQRKLPSGATLEITVSISKVVTREGRVCYAYPSVVIYRKRKRRDAYYRDLPLTGNDGLLPLLATSDLLDRHLPPLVQTVEGKAVTRLIVEVEGADSRRQRAYEGALRRYGYYRDYRYSRFCMVKTYPLQELPATGYCYKRYH